MFSYEIIRSLNEMETLVYDYIIKNKTKIKYMTVRELADEVHVSTATIMRFCKKCGFDGYSEFKVNFKQHLEQEKAQGHKVNEDVKELQEYFDKISSGIHQRELDEIADVVREARQVIFIGLGTSGILGKYGARFFSNLKKFSQYIEDPYYPIMEGIQGAVIIALSVSGETEQIIAMTNEFKKYDCKIISITNKGTSTLARISDYNLSYYVTEHEMGHHVNTTTQIPVIYLIEAIGRRL